MANVIQFRTVAKEASLTADCPEDFPYEAKPELRDPAVREGYWRVAMGLQEVDGLKPSPYLRDLAREHVSGVRGLDETGSMIRAYHARQKADGRDEAAGEREADLVSQRIVELLASGAVSYTHLDVYKRQRYGGDEFVMLMTDIDDEGELRAVLDEMVGDLHVDIQVGDAVVSVHCSIGAAVWDRVSEDVYKRQRHGWRIRATRSTTRGSPFRQGRTARRGTRRRRGAPCSIP